MPEAGEVGLTLAGGSVGELAGAETRGAEGGREARQGGRRQRRRGPRSGAEGDVELLEAVEGRGPEPGVEAGEREVGDGEAAGGAPVRGEDAGDSGLVGVLRAAAGREVERRRAPERAPPGGERLRARAILGGEERDDVAEDLVGEKADQIGAGASASGTRRRFMAARLLLQGALPLRLGAGGRTHDGIRSERRGLSPPPPRWELGSGHRRIRNGGAAAAAGESSEGGRLVAGPTVLSQGPISKAHMRKEKDMCMDAVICHFKR